jgi:hypothetical protein
MMGMLISFLSNTGFLFFALFFVKQSLANAQAVELSKIKDQNIFLARENQGICYRIPSIAVVNDYVVAVASKRLGHKNGSKAKGTYKMPMAHPPKEVGAKMKARWGTATPCADEAVNSIVMKIAKIQKNARNQYSLGEWSREIVVMDPKSLVKKAINSNSAFFEPALREYYLRLRAGYYNKKPYAYASHFNKFIESNHELKKNQTAEQWLKSHQNALDSINIRWGSQSIVGYQHRRTSYVSIAAKLAYVTAPHSTHNGINGGEMGSKILLTQIDLDAVWNQLNANQNTIVLGPSQNRASRWMHSLDLELAQKCGANIKSLIDGDSLRFNRAHLNSVLAFQARPFKKFTQKDTRPAVFVTKYAENKRLAEEIPLMTNSGKLRPANLRSLIDFFSKTRIDYANIDVTRNSNQIHFDLWRAAIKHVLKNINMYPGIGFPENNVARNFIKNHVQPTKPWNAAVFDQSLRALSLGRSVKNNTGAQKNRLEAVMTAYGYLMNTQLNVTYRELTIENSNSTIADKTIKTQNRTRDVVKHYLRRNTRIGPGNGVYLPSENKLLFLMPGSHFKINVANSNVECAFNDSNTLGGSERQATVIGTLNGKDQLFMTVRNGGQRISEEDARKKKPAKFNLAGWTRHFSISTDASETWSNLFSQPPIYRAYSTSLNKKGKNKLINHDEDGKFFVPRYVNNTKYVHDRRDDKKTWKHPRIDVIRPGFESSAVLASTTAVPNFFGPNSPLLLHLHPQSSREGIIIDKNNVHKKVPCLAENPSDPTKDEDNERISSRCDYRYNMTIVPAQVNNSVRRVPGRVTWNFDNALTIRSGSGGYSAMASIGEADCNSAYVLAIAEGPRKDKLLSRGFNNGINVHLIKATGARFASYKNSAGRVVQCRH